jgi:DNA-binding protein
MTMNEIQIKEIQIKAKKFQSNQRNLNQIKTICKVHHLLHQ